MSQKTRILIENSLIFFITAVSCGLFISTFVPLGKLPASLRVSFAAGRMVQRAVSIVLIIISLQLLKRKRNALYITLLVLMLNFLRNVFTREYSIQPYIMAVDAICIVLFTYFRSDFCCPSEKNSQKYAVRFLVFSFCAILINSAISCHYFRTEDLSISYSLAESFLYTLKIMFGFSGEGSQIYGSRLFEAALFYFNWGCIIISVLYIFKPALNVGRSSISDFQHAKMLTSLYGQNPDSYLALEKDKLLYFGHFADGVIAYGVVGDTIVVLGDPICSDENFDKLLNEFCDFCHKSAHNLFIMNITEKYIEEYKKYGFGIVKCGEEARFDLEEYEISGKKGAKMRMNINHATKAGVTVHEYCPIKERNSEIENAFNDITQEWLSTKKSSMLVFSIGTVGLDNPMDKRYFYSTGADGKITAFIVFMPFMNKKGYMADITRHGNGTVGGEIEKIMYEAFQVFKDEGALYASLGIAPLAGLDEGNAKGIEKLLNFVYEKLNSCYGFKNLYHTKENYSPTKWLPSYYAYMPKIPTVQMFYALVKIQNPGGITDFIKSFAEGKLNHEKEKNN